MSVMYEDEEWLHKEYVTNKRTINEIATDLGVADSTVHKKLVRFDISRRPTTIKTIYLDYDNLYQEYEIKGRSPYEICKDFGCSCNTIYRELKRLKIPIRSRRESKLGKRNPMFGKVYSEEERQKISERGMGHIVSEETRGKISIANSGENNGMYGIPSDQHPMWRDGASFESYCPKFDLKLKEKIRNRDNRNCQLCGMSELFLGERLCVHHIDLNKMQGCEGHDWYLVSLCRKCHRKIHIMGDYYK